MRAWLADAWPFAAVAYPSRDAGGWPAFEALPWRDEAVPRIVDIEELAWNDVLCGLWARDKLERQAPFAGLRALVGNIQLVLGPGLIGSLKLPPGVDVKRLGRAESRKETADGACILDARTGLHRPVLPKAFSPRNTVGV